MQPMPAHYNNNNNNQQQPPQQQQQFQESKVNPQQQYPPQVQMPAGPSPMPYQSLQTASMPVWCQQCNRVVNTVTTFEAGNFTHVSALLLCCFTWCCCWIPYVFNGMQDVKHKCPTCPTTFAIFHRSGRTEVLVTPGPQAQQQPQPIQPQPQQQPQQQPPQQH